MALRGRGDRGGRVRRARRRAGRHPGGARAQAARQDRPDRRPAVAASCSPVASCPSHGSRPPSCWSGGSVSGSTSRCWTNATCGPNGSTPSCSNTVWVFPRRRSAPSTQTPAAGGARGDIARVGPAADRVGYAMIDATDAQPSRCAPRRVPLRHPPAGLPGAGRASLRDRWAAAVAIWCELGDCRRFSRSMQVVRHTGLDVTVDSSDRHRAVVTSRGKVPRRCGGRCTKQPRARPDGAARITTTTPRSSTATTASWRRSPSLGNSPGAATTCCATWIPTSSTPTPPEHRRRRRPEALTSTSPSLHRGQLPPRACPPVSGRTAW